MNYVAHLFLSEPRVEPRIGSLLADFTNGTIDDLKERFGEEIAIGIRHHREIDRFTDEHPAVQHSVGLLEDGYGLYAGIIVDVVHDHFLLNHWDEFSRQTEESFFESVYESLDNWRWDFPARYRTAVRRMLETRWLAMYKELDNVGYALSRIDERFSWETPLVRALSGLREFYQELDADFLEFFPQLRIFSETVWRRI